MTPTEKLVELRKLAEKSSKVVRWYAHGGSDGTVRGPYMRWFKCLEIEPEYRQYMASVTDDVEYCAAAMNELPRLIESLEVAIKALDDIEKSGHGLVFTAAMAGKSMKITQFCIEARTEMERILADG